MHIEYSISVISNIIIFIHIHELISMAVCEMTQMGEKDRVNKEMTMIVKAEINNSLSLSVCLSSHLSLSSSLFLLWCFIVKIVLTLPKKLYRSTRKKVEKQPKTI